MCDRCDHSLSHAFVPSRRGLLLGASALLVSGIARAKEAKNEAAKNKEAKKEGKKPPKPQNVLSPKAALEELEEGNERYVEGVTRRHDFKHEREALASGQNPYAAILSCADSRIAPEYAFDSGRGDLFVCRVAGNFAN
ncbi:MAG TPA: carbonic anhydrase, partial [Dongiaceae bacterium]